MPTRFSSSWLTAVLSFCLAANSVIAEEPAQTSKPKPAPETAHFDHLELKDGTEVKGIVREFGACHLQLEIAGGSRMIRRRDVSGIRVAKDRPASSLATTDAVIRADGHRIEGEIQALSGGQLVRVTLKGGSRVTLPRSQVAKIIRKGDAIETDTHVYTKELGGRIAEAIERLSSSTEPAARLPGADEKLLLECGIFAIEPVRVALQKKNDVTTSGRDAFARVDRVYRYKELTEPAIEDYDKDVAAILTYGDASAKENLLFFLFSRFVGESVPLALALVEEPRESVEIRAYGIDFLRRMQRNRELLDLYSRTTGRVQLATAIALGRNQILLGIPTLIEALELDDEGVRTLAVRSLREFSAKTFRFRPDGAPEARRKAVAAWREWWESRRTDVEALARKVIEDGALETPERRRARELWQRAELARGKGDGAFALSLLQKSLTFDPKFFRAQISIAALHLTDLADPAMANVLLEKLEQQKRPDLAPEDRFWIYFYLGHARATLGDEHGALEAYGECVLQDPNRLDGLDRLAETAFRVATTAPDLSPGERRKLLATALETYEQLRDAAVAAEGRLVTFDISDLPSESTLLMDRRLYNRTVLDFRRKYRLDRFRSVLAIGRIRSLRGEQDRAIETLEASVGALRDYRDVEELRPVEIKIRNLLGTLYEGAGDNAGALRQYRFVQSRLDRSDAQSRQGLRRLGADDNVGN